MTACQENEQKAIILDLDGTLLHSDGSISNEGFKEILTTGIPQHLKSISLQINCFESSDRL